MPEAPPWIAHTNGITTVDAFYTRPGYAAIHVIEREGRVALVDAATNDAVPHLLGALQGLGVDLAAVEMVFITHVHLDHAGGAGRLMQELPNARAVAHPRAVQHLVDPSRLIRASRDVYGRERFEALYGMPLPIEPERILQTRDGDQLTLGGSQFEVLHTPGHALHHHALYDIDSASVFTGDTFGLSYRCLDSEQGHCILPTTTPSQFDPGQLQTSINRIVALKPAALYLTHFGRVTNVARLGASLRDQLQQFVNIATKHAASGERQRLIQDDLRSFWLGLLQRHACRLDAHELDDLLRNDLELNAQGLVAWLERDARPRG